MVQPTTKPVNTPTVINTIHEMFDDMIDVYYNGQ